MPKVSAKQVQRRIAELDAQYTVAQPKRPGRRVVALIILAIIAVAAFASANRTSSDFARLTLSNIVRDLEESGRQSRLWRDFLSVIWFRTMQFWGTYQGYRQSGPVTQALRQTFYYPPGHDVIAAGSRGVRPIRYEKRRK